MNALLNVSVLCTLACWGVWGIFDKKALSTSSHVGVFVRLYAMLLWETPIVLGYLLLSNSHIHLSSELWVWTALAALAQILSFGAYLLAMSITEASVVLGVTAAYPIVTQLIAVSCLHESFVPGRMIGALAIAAGVFAIGGSDRRSLHQLNTREKLLLAVSIVLATCGWGLWGILDKVAVSHGGVLETWLAESIWGLVFVVALLAVGRARGQQPELRAAPAWGYAFLSALSLFIGRIAFLQALNVSSASYVLTVTGCYPLVMYVFALLFLREKFDRLRLAGIGLVVAGGIAVQLTQAI